ncbi:MAG: hypothetical protein DMF63_02330 [Acidobacteria bacterium]|nr:MAG: hypothetical protein DMF63_02330 [Acidobacteriota bacterium]
MSSLKSRFLLRIISTSVFILVSLVIAYGQQDADPNSPTPVILSENDSTRALSSVAAKPKSRTASRAFLPGQRAEIFVTNISFMDGEGANSVRVYIEDAVGHEYRFPVIDVRPSEFQRGVYNVVFEMTDELRYWIEPPTQGDVLVRLTWRGLSSNRVRLAYGSSGGTIKDDPGAVPTPFASVGKNNSPTAELVGYKWSGDRMRFLEQATFGPTQSLDSRIRRIGLRTWLAEQFEMSYPSVSNPYPNIPLKSTDSQAAPPNGCGPQPNPNTPEYQLCIRDHYQMYPIQTWFYKEALYGEPQLHHRVSWALSQIWVISGVDTQQSSWMIEYHQQLSKNAFGNWRTLMSDMTLNPGMGNYLDMIRSTRTNPNENYPREVLQLFNIGLFMLNQDGTVQVDGQNNPIPTYDQNTINNFTKVFTGWRDCRVADLNANCPDSVAGLPDYKDPMSLNTGQHDLTAKTLLIYPGVTNQNVPACTGCTAAQIYTYAYNSLNQALDNIYNHPNVAPFVSKLLIQQMVTSDPTPAYVGRVSAVFNANRNNPAQMKEVVRAILLDPEARGDVKSDPRYGKLREPVQLMTNIYRNFNVSDAAGTGRSDGDINRFPSGQGQNAFIAPTVFNYYPPNFIVPGTTLLAPEFGIFTTGTAIGRANIGNSLAFGQINVALPNTPSGTKINIGDLQALAAGDTTSNQLLDHLNTRMMHGTMSPQMKTTLMTAVNAVASTNPLARAQTAVYLIATSSQFQVQR